MKKAFCLFLILSLSLLSGCYQRREINTLPIVMGFGVDSSEGATEFISQIAIPSNIVSGGSVSSSNEGKSPYVNIRSDGDYAFPSLRSSANMLGEKLYMAHNLLVVFGQDIAEKGINSYMDFFLRDHELRLNMYTLVADGKASDILSSDSDFHSIPSIHITKLVEALDGTALGVNKNAFDYFSCISSGKRSALMPLIHIVQNGGKDTLQINGTAVFQNDKMVGTLDTYQTRGYLWAMGNVSNSVITASVYDTPATVETLHSKGELKVDANGGAVTANVDVIIDASIGSVHGSADFSEPATMDALCKSISQNVTQEIVAAFEASKEMDSDFFGIEEALYRSHFSAWKKLKSSWNNAFKKAQIKVNVDTKILETGRIQRKTGG